MIDQPPAVIQMVPSGGMTTVTLPSPPSVQPIAVWPTVKEPVRVFDQGGRLVGTIEPGFEMDFEMKPPRWWQFWRRSDDLRWEVARYIRRNW